MRTNPAARVILRIHVIVVWLAFVAIAGLGIQASQLLAERLGQIAVLQTAGPQAPHVSLADMMAVARR